jgi:hypothetical protein
MLTSKLYFFNRSSDGVFKTTNSPFGINDARTKETDPELDPSSLPRPNMVSPEKSTDPAIDTAPAEILSSCAIAQES